MKQMVCSCGWKSQLYPDGSIFAGYGGELQCPDCARLKRNKGIEVYGRVKVISLMPYKGWSLYRDWKPLSRVSLPERLKRAHYYSNFFSLCGNHFYSGDDYLPVEFVDGYLPTMYISKCKACEKKLKKLK